MRDKVLNWYLTGQVGASSRAMATHLCGAPCDGSYPHDPDDLNRCLLFLAAVPEARAELPRMAEVNKRWAALVARWDEIEASFLAEAGLNWCKSRRAPNTYRMMCEAIDSANTAGQRPARVARQEKTMDKKETIEAGNSLPPTLGSQDNRCCENCLWWSTFVGNDDDGECIESGVSCMRWGHEKCDKWCNR